MQTSSGYYNFGRDPSVGRKGHTPQISISDDNHHVTEAIGDMYGDPHYGKRDSRPLSFTTSTSPTSSPPRTPSRTPHASHSSSSDPRPLNPRNPLIRTTSTERIPTHVNGNRLSMVGRSNSGDGEGGQLSPSNSLRERATSETAFPLNDIDYESSPNAVAQELNNLAALRRMSMDVNSSGDPDLPSFNSNFGIPTTPPVGSDPDDRARLYWVPANVHPELAPMEFKAFVDKKVKSIKRRSEEKQNGLSPDGPKRDGSLGSLRRRKSMLSRQIDNTDGKGAEGYQDGAERLDRRRSQSSGETLGKGITNLQELEILVNEPEKMMERLSLETAVDAAGGEVSPSDDMPILPGIPTGSNSLRRSTRTTYRRGGSLRRGERAPFSKRAAQLAGGEGEPPQRISPITPDVESFNSVTRVQTEPTPTPDRVTENFSRPGRLKNRRVGMPPPPSQPSSFESPRRLSSSYEENQGRPSEAREQPKPGSQPRHFVSQIASNGRLGVPLGKNVPSIVETPPPAEDARAKSNQGYLPERSSSHSHPPTGAPQGPAHAGPSPSRAQNWSPQSRTNQSVKPSQTLNDMTSHPSPLPGNNTRTDSLSFIPTLTEDKKADNKKLKDKKEKDGDGTRKSSWSWGSLLGNEEKEKEKRKEEEARKAKARIGKTSDKAHDSTRLDLLQATMEGTRGRESLVLDRGDLKLEEERKKESSRKSSGGDPKKDKETGFFSSLLGGGKKKGERDSAGRKHFSRTLSPDPPMKILKPDIDYNWTRFSILEERAIYRMAHIKLANPRRALHSQVLLSNFMYSYLAKVQQMHPQANLPQSAAQRVAAQQKKEQPEEFSQYQKYQEQQERQHREEQERAAAAAAAAAQSSASQTTNNSQHEAGNSMEEYDYETPEHDTSYRPQSRASQHTSRSNDSNGQSNHNATNYRRGQQRPQYERQQETSPYAYQQSQFEEPARSADDDMW